MAGLTNAPPSSALLVGIIRFATDTQTLQPYSIDVV